MTRLRDRVVFVTGASSGIGAACARAFACKGARLLLAARRLGRLEAQRGSLRDAGAADVHCLELDVRDRPSVERAIQGLSEAWRAIEVLVNNAGLSRGLGPLQQGRWADWDEMIETNVKGLLHVDRAVLPLMIDRGRGTVIHVGSIAGREVYPGGNVYCATKHAVAALTRALRLDLNGTGVRVCTVDPGLVDTEFSAVRFRGDERKARQVYRGMTPLSGDDVAEVVVFAASRPPHVELAETLLLPTDQASATMVHREG